MERGRLSSDVPSPQEPYKQEVAGSSPAPPTLRGIARTAAGTLWVGTIRRRLCMWISFPSRRSSSFACSGCSVASMFSSWSASSARAAVSGASSAVVASGRARSPSWSPRSFRRGTVALHELPAVGWRMRAFLKGFAWARARPRARRGVLGWPHARWWAGLLDASRRRADSTTSCTRGARQAPAGETRWPSRSFRKIVDFSGAGLNAAPRHSSDRSRGVSLGLRALSGGGGRWRRASRRAGWRSFARRRRRSEPTSRG